MTLTQTKAQEYILNTIDSEAYEVETKTNKEKLQFLFDTFKKANGKRIGQIGTQKALEEWFQGLPTVFPLAFTNYDILELAKKWGTLEENATEAKEDKYLEGYWRVLAANTIQLFNKNKIQ
jgi:hypothetical protein